ncbi:MAG: 16S rRNA (cytidine(1402)-2'-O)-methyltransferase [Xylanivirga thermophila]|jgi:16S rRNA (cytidine1402-2'-O)-methyltransferase|uniref:16S rRNA (cytidine(1402)-2'-O)-methyltransferase n=1 Tax=Xylanivirga thermophila TaxID=2496273 RepID=UPI0039F592FD
MDSSKGMLYLCATPIGNLDDITLRALKVLKMVDYIAAEDTRRTIKLLNYFDIRKPLISYHEHNKQKSGEHIVELLKDGYNVALVTDAGMPGISDPGYDLNIMAYENGVSTTIIPGASAGISALVLSGLPTDRFVFEGFLSVDKKERKTRLEEIRDEKRTIILYEAPHRLLRTLKDLKDMLGNRPIAVVRELTKVYEEVLRMDIEGTLEYFSQKPPKGEFVLVIEGAEDTKENSFDDISIEEHIKDYISMGISKKDAIKRVAKDRGIPKSQVYKYGIGISDIKDK